MGSFLFGKLIIIKQGGGTMWQGLCYEIERQNNLKRMKDEEMAKKRKQKKELCLKCKLKRKH